MDVMKKVPVREQAPDVRNKNFDEVCLGYNKEEAMEEATLLPFFDPDHPVNLAAKQKREEAKAKASATLAKTGSAIKKVLIPPIKR